MTRGNGSTPKSAKSNGKADRYAVEYVPVDSIKPSPENEDIYGPIERDGVIDNLIDSIRVRGLEEPLLVTADRFILSGHRRYFAVCQLGWKEVPIRLRPKIRRQGNPAFHRELIEYNPQRIKGPGALLREALLRDNDPKDAYAAIEERREASLEVEVDFMDVDGAKTITPISKRRRPFLRAVQAVVEKLKPYWPLNVRQIHYQLLNNPPLKQTPARSRFDPEKYRYRNDKPSFNSLVDLLGPARYHGQIPMSCIDDPTRPQKTWGGFSSVEEFVRQEVDGFLTGFHRDRQLDQPRHIEVFGEKNTLFQLLKRACSSYYVPFSIGRGFCSIPVWRDIARRFRQSGKDQMTLLIVSDFDPEGLELADDAIRSLKLHKVPVDGHRVAVTREQIDELELVDDFNPAKESSTRYDSFVERTGDTKCWEVEALPPEYLIDQIRAAIEANMDMEIYEEVCDQEEEDCVRISEIREEIATQLDF